MDKRIIMAVAGAGKTYHICHAIDPEKKNLILAYTHENIYNIKKELLDAFGNVPSITNVITFDAFVYRYLLQPYEPTILEFFNCPDFRNRGITTIDPPPQSIKRNGRAISNPKYSPKNKFEHYISSDDRYYCSRISELIMQIKKERESLIKRAASALNMFYDCIMIDEFQDYREHDYDLLMGLTKYVDNILLVGDFYQHSVSALNNTGRPFKKGKRDITYSEFVEQLKKFKLEVDESSLRKSRRCSKSICDFVKEKLNIDIESYDNHEGSIIWVDQEHIDVVINDDDILKLFYSGAGSFKFNSMNWSYSKGDTVEKACVILTDATNDIGKENFDSNKLANATLNKLYVALTRSRGDLYIIKFSDWKKYKNDHGI